MKRRSFLRLAGVASLGLLECEARPPGRDAKLNDAMQPDERRAESKGPLTLFLCGDVMTGRGIDQVLPHSVDPRLHESWVRSALDYVALAERRNGPIPRPVELSYIWGDALQTLKQVAPEATIINLETAVTSDGEPWPHKGIHYRMHPKNAPFLTTAGIQCCVLANNHVLDWGRDGFEETLAVLRSADLQVVGAGRDFHEAVSPAALPVSGRGRVLVFAFGHQSSGIPRDWAAGKSRAGVNLLDDFSERSVQRIAERVRETKQPGDVAVASIHWGGNWGYAVPDAHRSFAHGLVDRAGIDLVHGHSSHHPKGVEVYRDRPILYGCGDFINDYEGIRGHEEFRGDLSLMYFPRFDRTNGRLLSLEMVPMQIRRFRLHRVSTTDARWLAETLDRESTRLGCRIDLSSEEALLLRWDSRPSGASSAS